MEKDFWDFVCKSDQGYNIVLEAYKEKAGLIKTSLDSIKKLIWDNLYMQTLIKWPGGKTQEYVQIKDLIPTFDRYIEPFFGGGAIFFQLKPQKRLSMTFATSSLNFTAYSKQKTTEKNLKN